MHKTIKTSDLEEKVHKQFRLEEQWDELDQMQAAVQYKALREMYENCTADGYSTEDIKAKAVSAGYCVSEEDSDLYLKHEADGVDYSIRFRCYAGSPSPIAEGSTEDVDNGEQMNASRTYRLFGSDSSFKDSYVRGEMDSTLIAAYRSSLRLKGLDI
ncbi:hypothetical protein KY362_08390 [Candidatus Woesearchaeota archaeon]|nr:hypothetical protein [Candidatus Woesearchaeota archaeon]